MQPTQNSSITKARVSAVRFWPWKPVWAVAADDALYRSRKPIAAAASGDDALRVEAAEALVQLGDWRAAEREAAYVTSCDATVAAAAALHRSRALWFAGDVPHAREVAESGLALLGVAAAALVAGTVSLIGGEAGPED